MVQWNRGGIVTGIKRKYIAAELLILLSVMALAHLLRNIDIEGDSFIYLVLFGVESYIAVKVLQRDRTEQDSSVHLGICSYVFSFLTLIGALLSRDITLNLLNILLALTGAFGVALIVFRLIGYLFKRIETLSVGAAWSSAIWHMLYLGMLLIWLPTYLAFFPGLFTNDVPDQAIQTFGSYHTHHPLLHTLLLQAFLNFGRFLGNINIGIALMCIVQMLLLAWALIASLRFLMDNGTADQIVIILWLLFSMNPIFPVMAITTTKDIPFTICWIFFLLLMAKNRNLPEQTSGSRVAWIALAELCMLFRNNAVYAIAAAMLLSLIWMRGRRKEMIRLAVLMIAIYLVLSRGLVFATAAKSEPTKRELLSVPCQQVARVYVKEALTLSDEEKEGVLQYVPDAGSYHAIIADYTKEHENIDSDPRGFMKLYLHLLRRYPYRYVESFLINTMGYWYADDRTAGELYGVGAFGTVGYMYLYQWEHLGMRGMSLIPPLRDLYYKLFAFNDYVKIPVFSVILKEGFYLWVLFFAWARAEDRKDGRYRNLFVFVLMLFLTYLLGPCASLRYAFPYMAMAPILFGLVVSNRTHGMAGGERLHR